MAIMWRKCKILYVRDLELPRLRVCVYISINLFVICNILIIIYDIWFYDVFSWKYLYARLGFAMHNILGQAWLDSQYMCCARIFAVKFKVIRFEFGHSCEWWRFALIPVRLLTFHQASCSLSVSLFSFALTDQRSDPILKRIEFK